MRPLSRNQSKQFQFKVRVDRFMFKSSHLDSTVNSSTVFVLRVLHQTRPRKLSKHFEHVPTFFTLSQTTFSINSSYQTILVSTNNGHCAAQHIHLPTSTLIKRGTSQLAVLT